MLLITTVPGAQATGHSTRAALGSLVRMSSISIAMEMGSGVSRKHREVAGSVPGRKMPDLHSFWNYLSTHRVWSTVIGGVIVLAIGASVTAVCEYVDTEDSSTTPPPTLTMLSQTPPRTPVITPIPTGDERISVSSPVARGNEATVSLTTTPGANCSIVVTYSSGPSNATGLEAKTADPTGTASWTWTVGTRTTPGDWPVAITCDGETVQATFTVE